MAIYFLVGIIIAGICYILDGKKRKDYIRRNSLTEYIAAYITVVIAWPLFLVIAGMYAAKAFGESRLRPRQKGGDNGEPANLRPKTLRPKRRNTDV